MAWLGQTVPDQSETGDSLLFTVRTFRYVCPEGRRISTNMMIRVNADTPEQARAAHDAGISGIGLCRTEILLLNSELSEWVHTVVVVAEEPERKEALSSLLPMCQAEFEDIFCAISPYPAFIRLLDPPLQDLLPSLEQIDLRASGAFSDEDWDLCLTLSALRQRLA